MLSLLLALVTAMVWVQSLAWELPHAANMAKKNVLKTFFFSFLATPQHMEFPGQESDPSHHCDPSCSCGTAGCGTGHHGAGLGIEPAS